MKFYNKGSHTKIPGQGQFRRTEDHNPGTIGGRGFTKVGSQTGYVKPMPGFQTQPANGRPSPHLAYRFTTPKGGRKW